MDLDASPSETLPNLKLEYQNLTGKERLVILRDFLAKLPPEQFDMSTWSTERSCGTVCCIGGWTNNLFFVDPLWVSAYKTAACIGLSEVDAFDLFYLEGTEETFTSVTHPIVIAHLDHIIATGEVSWSDFLPPEES